MKKQIHNLITVSAFRQNKHPRDLYHSLFADIESDFLFVPHKSGKRSRMDAVLKNGLGVYSLNWSLASLRKANSYQNKMNRQGVLTNQIDKAVVQGKRHYIVDNEYIPSVSSILRDGKDIQKYIDQGYANQVKLFGEAKATKSQSLPTRVGDFTHACLESYLLGHDGSEQQLNRSLGVHLKEPILNRIQKVVAVEYSVYNLTYQYAGTLDCVATLDDGKTYLLDWKTSAKVKSPSNIKDYYLQCAAYALAFYKNTGIVVDGVKICVMYRQIVGVRKPRRYDIFEVEKEQIRPLIDTFLEKTHIYHYRQDQSLELAF
jgi:hypothetical protein